MNYLFSLNIEETIFLISSILISDNSLFDIFRSIFFTSLKQGEHPVLSLFKFKLFLGDLIILLTNVFYFQPAPVITANASACFLP